jgi:hypothetical protein
VKESARPVAVITVVQPGRIAGKRELRHANRLFHAFRDAGLPEYLRAVRANSGAISWLSNPTVNARHSDVVGIKPFQFRI